MKGKTHDLNHDLTFFAHTINCVCHSIRSMFRVLGIYNFGIRANVDENEDDNVTSEMISPHYVRILLKYYT